MGFVRGLGRIKEGERGACLALRTRCVDTDGRRGAVRKTRPLESAREPKIDLA